MAELIDPDILRGWWNSEGYQRLLSFQPEEKDGVYQLPPAKYNELFSFIQTKIEHPAVMNPYLAIYLWKRYVRPSDVVIDPMAGVGGTPAM
ncbi:MAG: hypothetical protein QW420_02850 [Candidatus Caldarchaeum sp.]